MEAVAAPSRGWMAVCPLHSRMVQSPTCKRVGFALPAHKAFNSGIALRTSSLTKNFEDQSHLQFYVSVRCSRKEKMNKRSPKAFGKEVGNLQDFMRGTDERRERKKTQKIREGKRMGSSSSSSSSSESDCSDCESQGTMTMTMQRDEMRTGGKFAFDLKTESEQPGEIRRGRKFDVEKFRKEWEELSRSDLMNSIPRFTADFKIEPPLAVTIEHLQKSYDLPTTRPPPPMVADSAEPSNTAVATNSSISHSLATVAGLAVVEDISDAFSTSEIKPATAHVEVCMGGKCKKAGAAEILNSFQVAGRPGVTASPCKCMKNCKSAVSVCIQDEEGRNSQVYTAVSLEDVDVLLQKHCSTGISVAGLSSFDPQQFERELEEDC